MKVGPPQDGRFSEIYANLDDAFRALESGVRMTDGEIETNVHFRIGYARGAVRRALDELKRLGEEVDFCARLKRPKTVRKPQELPPVPEVTL